MFPGVINNDYCFEIANNSANSIKNENMIFMRNVNLFIEKEGKRVQWVDDENLESTAVANVVEN